MVLLLGGRSQAPDSDDEYAYLVQAGRAPGGEGEGREGGDEDEDERLRYEMELDEALEESYQQYLERKGHRDDVRKVRRATKVASSRRRAKGCA